MPLVFMLTISNKSDIVLGDDRGTIFLLPKTQAHSRFEKLNRFSVINRTAPFLLEGKMINKIVKICKRCKKEFKTYYKKQQYCSCKCRSIGEGNSHWKGGQRKQNFGYIFIYVYNHPYANRNYVLKHRLIMEKYLGRYLLPNEVVHHKNGNITDDRIENLELTTFPKHTSFHSKLYWTPQRRKEKSIETKRRLAKGENKFYYDWTNKHHTEETKRKMSLATKGIPKTEEHKQAMREGWKRRALLLLSKTQENVNL